MTSARVCWNTLFSGETTAAAHTGGGRGAECPLTSMSMFATVRQTQELLASFQQLDYYDDLMAGDSENFSLRDYAQQYTQMRDKYLTAAKALKMASGPYMASRDAYVAAGTCHVALAALRVCACFAQRLTPPHPNQNPARSLCLGFVAASTYTKSLYD